MSTKRMFVCMLLFFKLEVPQNATFPQQFPSIYIGTHHPGVSPCQKQVMPQQDFPVCFSDSCGGNKKEDGPLRPSSKYILNCSKHT